MRGERGGGRRMVMSGGGRGKVAMSGERRGMRGRTFFRGKVGSGINHWLGWQNRWLGWH